MKVSVIIPVYNTKEYIEKCLNSVLKQTYSQLEIIVVNDGSTDESQIVLEQYAKLDSRIKIVKQNNQGLSAARNTGMKNATGEYVVFLDSDDWLDEETIDTAVNKIKTEKADVIIWSYTREYEECSKPVFVCGTESVVWDKNGIEKLYQQMVGPIGKQLQEPQKVDSLITAWGKLYRKSLIENVEFVNTKIIGTEDALFNIQVFSKVRKAVYIPNTFSHYRKTNINSLTKKYKKQLVHQWKELYKQINQHLENQNSSFEYYQALSNRIALGLIGLGLNLIEDNRLNCEQKKNELKKILTMNHYKLALKNLPIREVPIHWKVFFLFARYRQISLLYFMLSLMDRMRGN